MLVGGATGAAIGGLTGSLASNDQGIPQGALDDLMHGSVEQGHAAGFREAMKDMASNPDMTAEVLEQMSPEARKQVFRRFDKSWLTRMFGG